MDVRIRDHLFFCPATERRQPSLSIRRKLYKTQKMQGSGAMSRSASSALPASISSKRHRKGPGTGSGSSSDDDHSQKVARSPCQLYGLNENELLCTSHADIFERSLRGLRTHRKRRATIREQGQTLDQILSKVPDLLFPISYMHDDPPLALPSPLPPPERAWRCNCARRPVFRSSESVRKHCRTHSEARLEEGYAQQVSRAVCKSALIWTQGTCFPVTLWLTTTEDEQGPLGDLRREIEALDAKRLVLPESTPLLSLLARRLALGRPELTASQAPVAERLEVIEKLLTELESSWRKKFKTLTMGERAAVYNYTPAHATSLQGIYGMRIPAEKTRQRRVAACARLLSIEMVASADPDKDACTAVLVAFLRASPREAEDMLRRTIRSTVAGKELERLRIGPTVQHLVQGMQYLLRLLVASLPTGQEKEGLLLLLRQPPVDHQSPFRLLYEFSRLCKTASLVEGKNGHPKFHVDWANHQHLRITDNVAFDAKWLKDLFGSMQRRIDELVLDLLARCQACFACGVLLATDKRCRLPSAGPCDGQGSGACYSRSAEHVGHPTDCGLAEQVQRAL